jgi:hypothetical protein
MANPSIRGHKGSFKIFENGQLSNIVDITSVSVSMDSSFSRTYYVGRPVGEGDQAIEGWSGSIELEVKDDSVDAFIDALITNNLNGIGVSDYTFLTSEEYGNGQIASYAYFDVQWKMSKSQSGLSEKMTKTLEFQASGRVKI